MRLVEFFTPVLAVVRQHVMEPVEDAPALAGRLHSMLAVAQHNAAAIGATEEDVRDALFAVAAWADEAILGSDWSAAAAWQEQLLQRHYFGIMNAGMAFFERLAQLPEIGADVEEVYVLCLSIGFSGRYGFENRPRELIDVHFRAMQRVMAHAGANAPADAQGLVFPGANVPEATSGPVALRRWRWLPSRLTLWLVSIFLVLLVVLHLIFSIILKQQVDSLLPLVR